MRLFLILFLVLFGCYKVNTDKIIQDFKPGASRILVNYQDSLLAEYKSGKEIPKEIADSLKTNTWVKTANELAPSNIVIRQHCLIDLINGTPNHYDNIFHNVKILSYDGEIWAEGYSYWMYSYVFLKEWTKKFIDDKDLTELLSLIVNIDIGFMRTSYMRGELCYPAPFGDLRDIPLDSFLQNQCKILNRDSIVTYSNIVVKRISADITQYTIKGKPIGLNAHIPKDTFYVEVRKGIPSFKFYTGYQNKYSNHEEELLDILNIERVRSIKDISE